MKDQKQLTFFLIKFFIIFLILSQIIELINLSFLTNFITFISASYLGLDFASSIVFVNGANFIVTNSCTGLVSGAILIALLFAGKKPTTGKKLFLTVFGVCFLLLINIPRVMVVLLFAKVGYDAELVHTLMWFVMSGVVLLIWYYGNKTIGIKNFNELI